MSIYYSKPIHCLLFLLSRSLWHTKRVFQLSHRLWKTGKQWFHRISTCASCYDIVKESHIYYYSPLDHIIFIRVWSKFYRHFIPIFLNIYFSDVLWLQNHCKFVTNIDAGHRCSIGYGFGVFTLEVLIHTLLSVACLLIIIFKY